MAQGAGSPALTYIRGNWGSGWSSWYKMWNEANDGAGSGLDADKLDGQQGSYYYAASNPSGYTACTGNTRTDTSSSWNCRQNFNANNSANWDTMATSNGSQGAFEVYNNGSGNDAFFAFHAGGDYATYFGLDADTNRMATGGWSAGAVKYPIVCEVSGCVTSSTICASGASGYTLRTAGCIYSNSTIVAAGDVYGVSVCATNYVQATNYVYAAGSRLGSSNLFCGATCIHADADSKITFKNAGTNAVAMYADAGDELYLASNNAASGTVRIPSAGGIDASSGCIKGPIVCATSKVRVGNVDFSNPWDTRLKLCGSGDNYMVLGPANDNGWGYIESVNNSSGIYFNTNQGGFSFDTGHLKGYTDGEVDVGVSGGRFRCGHFSHTVTSYCHYATHCVNSPVGTFTSCVVPGGNGSGCLGASGAYWGKVYTECVAVNGHITLATGGTCVTAPIVCATTGVRSVLFQTPSVSSACSQLAPGLLYMMTCGGVPGFLGGDNKIQFRVMNAAGNSDVGYTKFTTDSTANFGISVNTGSSIIHRLCISTAGVVTAPHCFTTPISCATTCFSLSSGSNVTKICNSVGFTVVDSTEGLLVRDNSANVMEIRASGTKSYCNFNVCGSLSKASGCFSIPHPDPSKNSTHNLQHSFVESPTEGDNIYRWQVDTSNCASVITLPSYYRHLNKNDMVWVSPYKNFGAAYGEVTADQCCLIVCSNQDGCYNVLLIGTRKDEHAENTWTGPEVLKPTSSETGVPTPVHSSQL